MAVLTRYDKLLHKSRRVPSDLIVLKINRRGDLSISKPCFMCIKYMLNSQYNIKHIYYSLDNTTIIRTTLSELDSEPKHVSWRFRNAMRKNSGELVNPALNANTPKYISTKLRKKMKNKNVQS